jgi:hypothetical protein
LGVSERDGTGELGLKADSAAKSMERGAVGEEGCEINRLVSWADEKKKEVVR